MTDTTAALDDAAPVDDDAEPLDDEHTDTVQLVRTGWVRFRLGDELVRFRRPFFGELKRLRLALEDMSEAIGDLADETQRIGVELIREASEDDDNEQSDEDRIAKRAAIKKRSKEAGRRLTEFSEQQRVGWWRLVAELLSVDGELPDDEALPAWIVDANLPHRVIAHWRSVPLGRG